MPVLKQTRAEYDAIPGVTISQLLGGYGRTASHMHEELGLGGQPSEAKDFGSAFHCAVLEPEQFASSVLVREDYQRGSKMVTPMWKPEADGRASISADDLLAVKAMQAALLSTQTWPMLRTASSQTEVTLSYRLDELVRKGRVDLIAEYGGGPALVDLKTCQSASPRAFTRDCRKYGYHLRAAWYLDLQAAIIGKDVGGRYLFACVEKSPPYAVAFYELSDADLEDGRREYKKLLNQYVLGQATGNWLGWPDGVVPVSLGGHDDE